MKNALVFLLRTEAGDLRIRKRDGQKTFQPSEWVKLLFAPVMSGIMAACGVWISWQAYNLNCTTHDHNRKEEKRSQLSQATEGYWRIHAELREIMDKSLVNRGLTLFISQIIESMNGSAPETGGEYDRAYLWQGSQISSQLQIQRALGLLDRLKDQEHKISKIKSDNLVADSIWPCSLLMTTPAAEPAGKTAMFDRNESLDYLAIAMLAAQNGDYLTSLQCADRARCSLNMKCDERASEYADMQLKLTLEIDAVEAIVKYLIGRDPICAPKRRLSPKGRDDLLMTLKDNISNEAKSILLHMTEHELALLRAPITALRAEGSVADLMRQHDDKDQTERHEIAIQAMTDLALAREEMKSQFELRFSNHIDINRRLLEAVEWRCEASLGKHRFETKNIGVELPRGCY